VLDETAPLLTGRRLEQVVQLESHRFLLRFADPPFPRLHVAIHPSLSTLHLARGWKTPVAPTELAVGLTRELEGRRVIAVVGGGQERVARLELEQGRTLVIELMGKASNLLMLDGEGRILRHARTHQGRFRQPVDGEIYTPPPPSSRWMSGSLDVVEPALFARVLALAGPGRGLDTVLTESLPGLGAMMAREIAWRAERGEPAWDVFDTLRRRLREKSRRPMLYSPGDPAVLDESLPLTPAMLFAAPFPLACAQHLTATDMPTVNEAEAAVAERLLAHLFYLSLKHSLAGLLRQQRRRAADLAQVLDAELAEASAHVEADRRRGELILAGMRQAQREGSLVSVPDPYATGSPMVAIPIDPRLDLAQNAQRYFRSARRHERTVGMIPSRLETLRRRAGQTEAAEARLADAPTRADLETLERELQETGLVKAFRRSERAEVGRPAEYVPVREYHTSDGFDVLIGRTASDNDHLTFRVAAPHDLWLHAAGFPGAHVIVRNPKRLGALPESTVLQAAAIAAWFSKGRDENEIDVHVAWRRHVRKGKGMSPGMVLLKRHQTVRVAPAMPAGRGPGD